MNGIDLCLLQSGPSLAGWLVSSSLPSILTVSIGMLEYIALIIAIAQLSCFGPSMLDCSFGFCSEWEGRGWRFLNRSVRQECWERACWSSRGPQSAEGAGRKCREQVVENSSSWARTLCILLHSGLGGKDGESMDIYARRRLIWGLGQDGAFALGYVKLGIGNAC